MPFVIENDTMEGASQQSFKDKSPELRRSKRTAVSESDREEFKQPRRRPKRSRAQVAEEREQRKAFTGESGDQKRHKEADPQGQKRPRETATEDSEVPRKPIQPFPLLPRGMSQYLPTDTTDDSEGVSTLRTVDIEIIAGSDMPTQVTAGSAVYDLEAGATVMIPRTVPAQCL